MPINNLSVGRDITINLHTSQGELQVTTVTSFNARPNAVEGQVEPLDGSPIPYVIPNGFSGTIEFERTDASLDDFWDDYEDAYYLGQNLRASTITETINEVDDSQSQYIYTNVFFKADDLGPWSRNGTVKQTLSFHGARRQKIL